MSADAGKRAAGGGKRQTPLPPQQVAPSASGRTVAELAQKDPRRSDREREKQQQRKQATQVGGHIHASMLAALKV